MMRGNTLLAASYVLRSYIRQGEEAREPVYCLDACSVLKFLSAPRDTQHFDNIDEAKVMTAVKLPHSDLLYPGSAPRLWQSSPLNVWGTAAPAFRYLECFARSSPNSPEQLCLAKWDSTTEEIRTIIPWLFRLRVTHWHLLPSSFLGFGLNALEGNQFPFWLNFAPDSSTRFREKLSRINSEYDRKGTRISFPLDDLGYKKRGRAWLGFCPLSGVAVVGTRGGTNHRINCKMFQFC
ncbi:hypothetical protein DL93DRAFT_1295863 [Clavulina sp. PMI_390]|nr:hypothetical protein DL93DRAFT_1295863 [Clavulina sp. PMI_390]